MPEIGARHFQRLAAEFQEIERHDRRRDGEDQGPLPDRECRKEFHGAGSIYFRRAAMSNAHGLMPPSYHTPCPAKISAKCITRMGFFCRRIRPSMCIRQLISLAVRTSVPACSWS